MVHLLGQFLGTNHRFLSLDREFIEAHRASESAPFANLGPKATRYYTTKIMELSPLFLPFAGDRLPL
jgi:hypothetical protein